MANKLETYLLLAKSTKGSACVQLIQDALNANGVFVFAELLESPNVKEILPYDKLLQYLDIANVRELEDLIIDAIYQDIIKGKLDQKRGCVEIESAMGRDLKPGQADLVLETLRNWTTVTGALMNAIDSRLEFIHKDAGEFLKEKEKVEKQVEKLKKEEKGRIHTRGSGNEFDPFDPRREQLGMFEDDNRRHRRGPKMRMGVGSRR
ncbi:hypothetical protein HDU96_006075 [Phlyctochytrium bullatum]|nr:hypothetical protein HDU96_006075 [Phlyctochytrium bullatum]